MLQIGGVTAQTRLPDRPCIAETLTEFAGSVRSNGNNELVLSMNSGKVFRVDLAIHIFGTAQQACNLSQSRLLLFGDAGGGGITTVVIVDLSAGILIDTFYAYFPVLSPNRDWLAFRRFYPLQGTMDPSDSTCFTT